MAVGPVVPEVGIVVHEANGDDDGHVEPPVDPRHRTRLAKLLIPHIHTTSISTYPHAWSTRLRHVTPDSHPPSDALSGRIVFPRLPVLDCTLLLTLSFLPHRSLRASQSGSMVPSGRLNHPRCDTSVTRDASTSGDTSTYFMQTINIIIIIIFHQGDRRTSMQACLRNSGLEDL